MDSDSFFERKFRKLVKTPDNGNGMAERLTHDVLDRPIHEHMRTDLVVLHPDLTAESALDAIREQQPPGRIIYFYVADRENRLLGVVPTRRLLLSARNTPLSDLMIKQVISIPHTATALDACEFFIFHKLLAFPVVDEQRRILGVVDVDLYTQEIRDLDRRESQHDLFQLIGVQLSETHQESISELFRRRFPWLLATLAGGLIAAIVINNYYDVASLMMVVSFIPLVISLTSSVTSQSMSLALLFTNERRMSWPQLASKIKTEFITGLFLGLGCALVTGFLVFTSIENIAVFANLLTSIVVTMACAAVLGLVMPSLFRRLNITPQVATGPITIALVDVISLILYFNLSRLFLSGG